MQGYEISSNILAPKFHRCQFCFSLNPLMVVEVNILINEPPCFRKSLYLNSVYALRFEDRKKFSAKALSYGLPRLDIDGVIPYC